MESIKPDMDRPAESQNQHPAVAHTEDLGQLINLLGRATNLMGRARNVVDMGQQALPQVRQKLQSISYANEEAAMSIMNETETISELSNHIQLHLNAARSAVTDLNKLVMEAQRSEQYCADDRIKNYVDVLYNAVCAHELGFVQSLNIVFESMEQVKRSATTISMTLQVQDITAQQLAGAGQMVDHVQSNLTTMFAHTEPEHPQDTPTASDAFNADASFEKGENRQSMVDDLFSQIHKNMEG